MQSISVIIPTWNRAATLEKAIKSALKQTLTPLEVLVCDDGSTDESREIVKSINDLRVKWIDGVHSGKPSVPRNRGIQESKGEWLAFLDSDDEWLPDKLERQLEYAIKTGCDAVCSNAMRYASSKEKMEPFYAEQILKTKISFQDLVRNNFIICSSVLVKKDIVVKCEGFIEEKALIALEDYALWLRISTFTDFAYICEPLLYYRDMPESSIRKSGRNEAEQKIIVLKSFLTWVKNRRTDINNKGYIYATNKILICAHIKCKILHHK